MEIWLPDSAKPEEKRLRCLVCNEATFDLDEQEKFERHTVKCAKEREDQVEQELEESNPARINPYLWGPEAGDAEFEKWMVRNKDAILEYRLKP